MIAVVSNDYHVPFCDKGCVDLACRLVEELKPDLNIIAGDFFDTYPISRFDKRPFSHRTLDDEVDKGAPILERQSKAAVKTVMLGGNHEFRIVKWIYKFEGVFSLLGHSAEDAVKKLSPEKIFKLARHGVAWKDYGQGVNLGDLHVTHGESCGTNTSQANIRKYRTSILTGHNHRRELKCHASHAGQIESWTNGCLCALNPEYGTGVPDWQHALAVVIYNKNGTFTVHQLPVQRERSGKPYVMLGRDRISA